MTHAQYCRALPAAVPTQLRRSSRLSAWGPRSTHRARHGRGSLAGPPEVVVDCREVVGQGAQLPIEQDSQNAPGWAVMPGLEPTAMASRAGGMSRARR